MLTALKKQSILISITDTSVIGISLLKLMSVQALTRSAFFVPALWWAVWKHLRVRRISLGGKANSVQSATPLISLNRGSSLITNEDIVMPKNNTVCIPAPHLSHSLKIIGDIQALATIGEQAIIQELAVDASNYDVLFASIGQKAQKLLDDLDTVFIKSLLQKEQT